MDSKKMKVAIIGGCVHLSEALKNLGIDAEIAKHEMVDLNRVMEVSLPPRGKGKGDRVRRRQQWGRK